MSKTIRIIIRINESHNNNESNKINTEKLSNEHGREQKQLEKKRQP